MEGSAGVWVDAGYVEMIEEEPLGSGEGRETLVLATRDTCDKILNKILQVVHPVNNLL